MTHKVHPKIFRVKGLADWHSRWFDKKNLRKHLEEDFMIREFFKEKLKNGAVESIEIERFPGKVSIIINSARPGLIIGRGGAGIELMLNKLKSVLLKKKLFDHKELTKKEFKIELREVKNPWTSAPLSAQWVAQQLEKRTHHRRVMKQTLEKILANKDVKGARIEISGRLEGVDIARRAWLQKGLLPRQTIRADIDYAKAEALIPQGKIGIKVWIYKGEKLE
ncbi:MAG: 30S ribosomal protein S3 [Candidatus Nealsonbacteria bacterium]|nr:30S ribosomal protein S3 [Candidatus Nealsonbacteria bacterium]